MSEFMHSIPKEELVRIENEAIVGSYHTAQSLVHEELERRERIAEARALVEQAYIVPVDPMDDLQCESCQ